MTKTNVEQTQALKKMILAKVNAMTYDFFGFCENVDELKLMGVYDFYKNTKSVNFIDNYHLTSDDIDELIEEIALRFSKQKKIIPNPDDRLCTTAYTLKPQNFKIHGEYVRLYVKVILEDGCPTLWFDIHSDGERWSSPFFY